MPLCSSDDIIEHRRLDLPSYSPLCAFVSTTGKNIFNAGSWETLIVDRSNKIY